MIANSANNWKLIKLTDEQYKELKTKYLEARNKGDTQFKVFGGQEVLTDFCKYWLEIVEQHRKANGLPVTTERHRMTHKCKDGTQYEWTSRVDKPRLCPNCKSRINIQRVT